MYFSWKSVEYWPSYKNVIQTLGKNTQNRPKLNLVQLVEEKHHGYTNCILMRKNNFWKTLWKYDFPIPLVEQNGEMYILYCFIKVSFGAFVLLNHLNHTLMGVFLAHLPKLLPCEGFHLTKSLATIFNFCGFMVCIN